METNRREAPFRAGLDELYRVIRTRQEAGDVDNSYVARLSAGGQDEVLKKIGEECTELLLAAKNGSAREMLHELADLQFHLLVWMGQSGITPADLENELAVRAGVSGLDKKT
ncbi:MAG: phosphoribosyl-ATP diphosphatase [Deltaproteobacteria bacterium]|nr:phosphoribosyl-ATP diphosphatase [Deltaproteobacteria bacterium]